MTVRCLTFLVLFPAFLFGQSQYYGTRVGTLSLSGSATESDIQLLPLHPGDTITTDNVRAAIQTLYDTGRYGSVEVNATPEADGTHLTFNVSPVYYFSTFRLEPEDLLDRPISGFFHLPLGERFSQTTADQIASDTADLLHTEGYFDATVIAVTEKNPSTSLATVILRAQANRASVGKVTIAGAEDIISDRKDLYDALGLKASDPFSAEKLDSGLRKIQEKFVNLDFGAFLNTRIQVNGGNLSSGYDQETNKIDLQLNITPGTFTLVEVSGYDISQDKLKELVPIFEEGTVDDDLVEEGRNEILSYMQQRGYFEATVQKEIIQVRLENAIQINYTVDKGSQHEIHSIRIQGNQHFTNAQIKSHMKVREPGLFNKGIFSPQLLEQDRLSILALYQKAGFVDTIVDTESPEEMGHVVDIAVRIEEGHQLPIEVLSFEGNVEVPEAELRERSGLHVGDIYTPVLVESARNALVSMYYAKGFPDARVEQKFERSTDSNGAQVTYVISEGSSYMIGKVLVAGNTLTADKIVRRNANLFENTPYNPEAILDSQRQLYASGLFSRVDIVPLEQSLPSTRNVLIQVEDAKPILVTPSVGYQGNEGARGTIELSHNNLFGLQRSIDLRLRSTFLSPANSPNRLIRFQATYREPRLFNHDLDGVASIFLEKAHQTAFDASRTNFSIQIVKNLSRTRNLLLTASYQPVNLQDIRENVHAQELPDQTGIIQIAQLGPSFTHDTRDDPFNPTKGTFERTTFQVAAKPYGSEVNFTSLYNQTIYYWPRNPAVLAASISVGWNRPFGNTAPVPITERYFAGGSTTLRGYGQDKAGPQIGGNAIAIANVEYRFPLQPIPIRGLGGVFFYDGGNAFSKISDISLRDISHTIGTGLRYQTPVGPVRFDIGYRLYPLTNSDGTRDKRLHFFFTLGHTF
jgi:outer membrane protein insertion porin family